jgi:hypothetical protein
LHRRRERQPVRELRDLSTQFIDVIEKFRGEKNTTFLYLGVSSVMLVDK